MAITYLRDLFALIGILFIVKFFVFHVETFVNPEKRCEAISKVSCNNFGDVFFLVLGRVCFLGFIVISLQ